MKIVFFCGSLEPGRDGVGDYTRRLAGELIKQGHFAKVLSLNDKSVKNTIVENQTSDNISIQTCRIPNAVSNNERFNAAKKWINAFNPDWFSLQYVPFSFHKKGLPFGLGIKLRKLNIKGNWHIMFHELWVGMGTESSAKLHFWGLIQRNLIKSMLNNLDPKIIHTQTELYKYQINKLGHQSNLLPLFGNIPVKKRLDSNRKIDNQITIVVFGSIHYGAPIEAFAKDLLQYADKNKTKIKVLFLGRCGSEMPFWQNALNTEKIENQVLGEQSTEEISEILTDSDFGISTTPFLLAEKSGTTAAMIEHNLPVINISREWNVRNFDKEDLLPNIFRYSKGKLESILVTKKQNSLRPNYIETIAKNLISDFY